MYYYAATYIFIFLVDCCFFFSVFIAVSVKAALGIDLNANIRMLKRVLKKSEYTYSSLFRSWSQAFCHFDVVNLLETKVVKIFCEINMSNFSWFINNLPNLVDFCFFFLTYLKLNGILISLDFFKKTTV